MRRNQRTWTTTIGVAAAIAALAACSAGGSAEVADRASPDVRFKKIPITTTPTAASTPRRTGMRRITVAHGNAPDGWQTITFCTSIGVVRVQAPGEFKTVGPQLQEPLPRTVRGSAALSTGHLDQIHPIVGLSDHLDTITQDPVDQAKQAIRATAGDAPPAQVSHPTVADGVGSVEFHQELERGQGIGFALARNGAGLTVYLAVPEGASTTEATDQLAAIRATVELPSPDDAPVACRRDGAPAPGAPTTTSTTTPRTEHQRDGELVTICTSIGPAQMRMDGHPPVEPPSESPYVPGLYRTYVDNGSWVSESGMTAVAIEHLDQLGTTEIGRARRAVELLEGSRRPATLGPVTHVGKHLEFTYERHAEERHVLGRALVGRGVVLLIESASIYDWRKVDMEDDVPATLDRLSAGLRFPSIDETRIRPCPPGTDPGRVQEDTAT